MTTNDPDLLDVIAEGIDDRMDCDTGPRIWAEGVLAALAAAGYVIVPPQAVRFRSKRDALRWLIAGIGDGPEHDDDIARDFAQLVREGRVERGQMSDDGVQTALTMLRMRRGGHGWNERVARADRLVVPS